MRRAIFVALSTAAVITSAAALGIGAAGPDSRSMTRDQYEAALQRIDATRGRLSARCDPLAGSEREICLTEAAAHQMVQVAEVEAGYRRTEQSARALQRARIDARYQVERARCETAGMNAFIGKPITRGRRSHVWQGDVFDDDLPYVQTFGERRIVGIEGLMRWRHPIRGLLAPDQFMSIGETNGLSRAITAPATPSASTPPYMRLAGLSSLPMSPTAPLTHTRTSPVITAMKSRPPSRPNAEFPTLLYPE